MLRGSWGFKFKRTRTCLTSITRRHVFGGETGRTLTAGPAEHETGPTRVARGANVEFISRPNFFILFKKGRKLFYYFYFEKIFFYCKKTI